MVELVTLLTIIGIMAWFVIPKFSMLEGYQGQRFYDQLKTALRYAHRASLAQHRYVCVQFSVNSVTFSVGTSSACDTPLKSPVDLLPYVLQVPDGTSFSGLPGDFYFDPQGAASLAQSIAVSDEAAPITIESGSGYVH